MYIPQEVLQKIQKLHALSRSNHLGEAENASQMRDRLMEKYNITWNDVETFSTQDNALTEDKFHIDGKKNITLKYHLINSILNKHFFVTLLYHNTDRLNISIIGKQKDVTVATYVFHFLERTFEKEWKRYRKSYPGSHRNSFLYGLHDGLDQHLTLQQQEDVKEFGLVVIDNPRERRDYMKSLYSRVRTVRSKATMHEEQDYHQGVQTGQQIRIREGVEGHLTEQLPFSS